MLILKVDLTQFVVEHNGIVRIYAQGEIPGPEKLGYIVLERLYNLPEAFKSTEESRVISRQMLEVSILNV